MSGFKVISKLKDSRYAKRVAGRVIARANRIRLTGADVRLGNCLLAVSEQSRDHNLKAFAGNLAYRGLFAFFSLSVFADLRVEHIQRPQCRRSVACALLRSSCHPPPLMC